MRRTAPDVLAKDAKKYLASKSKRELERLLRERRLARKRRRGRVLRRNNPWEKWELALVGTALDATGRRAFGQILRPRHRAAAWPFCRRGGHEAAHQRNQTQTQLEGIPLEAQRKSVAR